MCNNLSDNIFRNSPRVVKKVVRNMSFFLSGLCQSLSDGSSLSHEYKVLENK